MLLTVTTTREPATDLGYLLVKHPERVHQFDVSTGVAYVCFPEASPQRCTAALVLEVDPARLTRKGSTPNGFALAQYVNDRPYAASSLLASALNRAFRSALRGESRDRPELAATPIPLVLRVSAVRCRGGAALCDQLFTPLGYEVSAEAVPLDETRPEWGLSRYVDLTLTGTVRLADALNQLYVLLPVLDDAKHYWVAPDEVDKLLRAGEGWLATHPARELIAHRYLTRRRALAQEVLERLEVLAAAEGEDPADPVDEEADLPLPVRRLPLAAQRVSAVKEVLTASGATRVLDLGCGSGALLQELVKDKRYTELVGVDVSAQALRQAERRLRRTPSRVRLVQSALTYTDDRLRGYDAAVLMEVIEHVDPPRLPALAASVFGHARPSTVVVTTPNVEFNAHYEGMTPGALRHQDHRFEWTRSEFAAWTASVATGYGYRVDRHGVGEPDPVAGAPTQLAVFTREAA